MVGRSVRRDRGVARAEPARLGAALALILGLAPAADAQAPAPDAREERNEPSFEFLTDADLRKQALGAWQTGDSDTVVGFAWGAADALRQRSLEQEGIDLLDLVLARYGDNEFGPALQALRGELKRAIGLFDAALKDLAAAEQIVRPEGSKQRDFTLQYVHTCRAEVWINMGVLHLADAELREEAQVTSRLAKATRKRGDLQDAAKIELSSAYQAASLDVAMGDPRSAADRMTNLLSGDLLQALPAMESAVEVRHGRFLLMVARDELHSSSASLGGLPTLGSARSALEASLSGELVLEEQIEARLCLVDAAWLAGDADLENRELAILEDLFAREPGSFAVEEQARLAAFGARRLLAREDRSKDDLLSALAAVEEAFARVEAQWRATSRAPEGLGFLHYPEQRLVVETLARLLIEIHGPMDGPREALAAVARAQAIGTLTLRLNPGALSAAELLAAHLAALPEGAGILAFLPSLDVSLVLAADREQVLAALLPAGSVLEERATKLGALVRRYPTQPRAALVAERAAALSEVLLPAEIKARVHGWRRVLCVGTELFDSPGLESIPLGPGTLGERLATSYLPSISLAELLRRRAPMAWGGAHVAFLAATGLGAGSIELRNEESKLLEKLVGPPGPGRYLATGEKARGQALQVGSETDLLAILGHGRYDPLEPRPASIELVDGPLGCEALERIELPPVVCLLACGAARGPRVVGDAGTAHLGGAALVGGAEAVLLSDTEIEVEATLALFESFLGHLRSGDAPDEALRQARLAVAERDPRWSDPFYSSGLRLFGWGGSPGPDGDR